MVTNKQFNEIIDEIKQHIPETIEYNDTPISLDDFMKRKNNKELYLSTLGSNISIRLEETSDSIGADNVVYLSSEELDELLRIDDNEEFLELL